MLTLPGEQNVVVTGRGRRARDLRDLPAQCAYAHIAGEGKKVGITLGGSGLVSDRTSGWK